MITKVSVGLIREGTTPAAEDVNRTEKINNTPGIHVQTTQVLLIVKLQD